MNVKSGSAIWCGTPAILKWSSNGTLIVVGTVPLATQFSRTVGYAGLNASTGATEWAKVWTNTGAFTFLPEYLGVDADGTFLLEADIDSAIHMAAKFSVAGTLLWSKAVTPAVYYPSISSNPAGELCLCYSATSGTTPGYQVVQVSAAGAVVSKFFAYSGGQGAGPQAAIDAVGGAYVTYSTPAGRVLDRISSAGAKLGSTALSNLRYSAGIIAFDFVNGVVDIASGDRAAYTNPATLKIYKVSMAGKVLWTSSYGVGNGDSPMVVKPDKKGDVIVLGSTPVSAGGFQTTQFVHKVASANGALLYHYAYAGKYACPDVPLVGLAVEPDGTPVVTGQSRLTGTEANHVGIAFRLGS